MATGLDSLYSNSKGKDGKLPHYMSQTLYIYNVVLASLHFGQVFVALYLIFGNSQLYDYEVPVTVTRQMFKDRVLKRWEHVWFTYKYVLIPPIILFATACYHVLYATYKGYDGLVAEGKQYIRWIEYLSSGFTMWLISQAFGVVDFNTLCLIVAVNSGVMYTGYLDELGIKYAFWFGCSLGLASWGPMINAIIWSNVSNAPWWVWFVAVGYLVCYWSFAVVAYSFRGSSLQSRFNREVGYLSLSGIAKSLLMWSLIGVGLGPGFYTKEKAVSSHPAINRRNATSRSSTHSACPTLSAYPTNPSYIPTHSVSPSPSTSPVYSTSGSVSVTTTVIPSTSSAATAPPSYTTLFYFASNGQSYSYALGYAITQVDNFIHFQDNTEISVFPDHKFTNCLTGSGDYNDLALMFMCACKTGSALIDPPVMPDGYTAGSYQAKRLSDMEENVFNGEDYTFYINDFTTNVPVGNLQQVVSYCQTYDLFSAVNMVYEVSVTSPRPPIIYPDGPVVPPDNGCDPPPLST